MKWFWVGILCCFCTKVAAASLSFTLEQALDWSAQQANAQRHNRASTPLASRVLVSEAQLWPLQDPRIRVLIAPDGMDNLAFEQPQQHMNHYLFRHWSLIDVFNWFAGTADNTVNLPATSWVEVAHRNGVKVIGSVFFAPTAWGGQPERVAQALAQDDMGRFVLADQLIAMADYYGFDGWLINQETDLTALPEAEAQQLAKRMQQFMAYLMANRPEGMEIHWYDAMLTNGAVRWQNEYNDKLAEFIRPEQQLLADGVFLNYFWRQGQPERSNQLATAQGIDPFLIFTGADVWPGRNDQPAFRNTEWLSALFAADSGQSWTSLALFGVNFSYRYDGDAHQPAFHQFSQDPAEVQQFYQTEQRFFAGDDLKVTAKATSGSWPGLQRYIPAKTVVQQLPFMTNFNTGHGWHWFERGEKVRGSWHDIRQQDLLPSWQFAVLGHGEAAVSYDFEKGWRGGSALLVHADTSKGAVQLPLYLTDLTLQGSEQLSVIYQSTRSDADLQLCLWSAAEQQHCLPLTQHQQQPEVSWHTQHFALQALTNKRISRIELLIKQQAAATSVHLGQLAIE